MTRTVGSPRGPPKGLKRQYPPALPPPRAPQGPITVSSHWSKLSDCYTVLIAPNFVWLTVVVAASDGVVR